MTLPTTLRLDHIELRNFRCFAEGAIDLHDKLTFLVAENGPGNTAILDAIGSSLGMWTLANVTVGGTPFWQALGGLGGQLKYPDGLINNQIMEIKGPGDFFKDPTQRQVFNDVSAPNAAIVVNCKSCKAKCENGPPASMSKGARRNAGCK